MSQVAFKGLNKVATAIGAGGAAIIGTSAGGGITAAGVLGTITSIGTSASAAAGSLLATPFAPVVVVGAVVVGGAALYEKYNKKKKA